MEKVKFFLYEYIKNNWKKFHQTHKPLRNTHVQPFVLHKSGKQKTKWIQRAFVLSPGTEIAILKQTYKGKIYKCQLHFYVQVR